MQEESLASKFDFLRSIPNLIVLSLIALAAVILAWVGQITLNDISVWNKNLYTILFGSRNGEAISLGVGMALIHYLLIGVSLLAAGLVFFIRNRMSAATPLQTMSITQKMSARTPINNSNNNRKSAVKYTTKDDDRVSSEERFFSGCLNHFGYLSSRPKGSPIPQECIICQRLGDCMVATVYVRKVNE